MQDAGATIDPSSTLFDGSPLNGPSDLRRALLTYSEAFVRNFTENLLTYAVGRRIEYYDMPSIRAITRDAARQNHRVSALVLGIVNSAPFQMRRVERSEAAAGRQASARD